MGWGWASAFVVCYLFSAYSRSAEVLPLVVGECSPLGLVALDGGAALHHVLEGAELGRVAARRRAEAHSRLSFILRDWLGAESAARVISLMLVELFGAGLARSSLGQGPTWLVSLGRGVG